MMDKPVHRTERAARLSKSMGLLLRDDRGANMILTLGIVGGFLALLPFFLDLTSVHFSYRMAQAGADAAAHAAAVEYAQSVDIELTGLPHPGRLSGRFRVLCVDDSTGREAAERYLEDVWQPTAEWASTYIGWPRAKYYAGLHKGQLAQSNYAQRVNRQSNDQQHIAGGIFVYPIQISVVVDREADLISARFYPPGFEQTAAATAEVYPEPVTAKVSVITQPRPDCPLVLIDPGPPPVYIPKYDWEFTFRWKVRLVE